MISLKGRPRQALTQVPIAIGSAGIGAVSAANPLAGATLGTVTIATFLPWAALFSIFALAALGNRWGTDIGGITVRAAQILLIPLTIRAFTISHWRERPRWYLQEWLLIGFIGLQFFTSYFNADVRRASLEDSAILAAGAGTYLLIYMALSAPGRLLAATRALLILSAVGAAVGALALAAYYVTGWAGGVEVRQLRVFGGAPPVRGLAYEHDLFGSTCAAGAIAFLSLIRQGYPLFKRRTMLVGLWACLFGTVIAQARASYVGLAVCFLLMYILPFPRKRRIAALPRVTTILVLLAVGFGGLIWASSGGSASVVDEEEGLPSLGASVTYQIGQSLNFSSGTGGQRLAKYRLALDELLESPIPAPLIGRGTNSWGQRHYHPGPNQQYTPAYLESLYMRSLYDSGVIGLILIAGFFILLVWPTRSVILSRSEVGPIARALTLSSMLLAIAYAATDSILLLWPWIVFGLTRAARYVATRDYKAAEAKVAKAKDNGG